MSEWKPRWAKPLGSSPVAMSTMPCHEGRVPSPCGSTDSPFPPSSSNFQLRISSCVIILNYTSPSYYPNLTDAQRLSGFQLVTATKRGTMGV